MKTLTNRQALYEKASSQMLTLLMENIVILIGCAVPPLKGKVDLCNKRGVRLHAVTNLKFLGLYI